MSISHESGDLALSKLRFDPGNPRLPPSVDGTDDRAVLEWMLADGSLLPLMDAIAIQGFFPGEPLLVSPWPELSESDDIPSDAADHGWVVVEGNRRLAALRLLTAETPAPIRPRAVEEIRKRCTDRADLRGVVPVVKFAKRNHILRFLGFRHITGIKEWDPLEKARYLREVRAEAVRADEPYENRDLARRIGSTGPYVGRLLTALEALERLSADEFLADAELAEDDIPFSFLVLALNYRSIVEFVGLEKADDPELAGLNDQKLRQLARWLFVKRADGTTPLGDSRNMKILAQVVTSTAAVVDLDAGSSLRDAAMTAVAPHQLLMTSLSQAVARMKVASREAGRVDSEPEGAIQHVGEVARLSTVVEKALSQFRVSDSA